MSSIGSWGAGAASGPGASGAGAGGAGNFGGAGDAGHAQVASNADDVMNPSRNSSRSEPWPVSKLNSQLKQYIDKLGYLWVEGELAKVSGGNGRLFAELRDLQIENVVQVHSWNPANLDAGLAQGDRVVALIKPEFWPKNGKLSMAVQEMRKVGLGDLLERIFRLRQQMAAEGLTQVKQPLPFLPNYIGLITGKDSDAEKDVLQNARLRWPEVNFKVINTLVQGDKAAPQIIAAIQQLDADPEVDVIIVARGGGAFGDLLVFSDEGVVRAAAATTKPIVSAIGHENDNPVLDDVADLRASTPTDAAKRVVPDVIDERRKLGEALARIERSILAFVTTQDTFIDQLRSRPVLANPFAFIDILSEDAQRVRTTLRERFGVLLDQGLLTLDHLKTQVRSLSPQQTLDRGYSVVRTPDGSVISDASKVKSGQKLGIRLAKGEIAATAD
jgi:exodeoxyribonuclease VII large subunit